VQELVDQQRHQRTALRWMDGIQATQSLLHQRRLQAHDNAMFVLVFADIRGLKDFYILHNTLTHSLRDYESLQV
jgi:hypothetical protein